MNIDKYSVKRGGLTVRVRYSLDGDEPMAAAVVNALEASGVEVLERATQLADWIDTEIFESLVGTPVTRCI